MATLDRVRRIDLEPSLAVWQEYAAAHAVHPAVLAYLRLHPEHFFVCDAQRAAGSFVTARGWEDLSALLLTYEALGFACTQTQAREYLHVPEIAAGFAAFYELYRRYAASLPLEALLRGQTDAGAEALRHPYSQALWRALPQNGFVPIPGFQPYAGNLPKGCVFAPRCPRRTAEWKTEKSAIRASSTGAAWRPYAAATPERSRAPYPAYGDKCAAYRAVGQSVSSGCRRDRPSRWAAA